MAFRNFICYTITLKKVSKYLVNIYYNFHKPEYTCTTRYMSRFLYPFVRWGTFIHVHVVTMLKYIESTCDPTVSGYDPQKFFNSTVSCTLTHLEPIAGRATEPSVTTRDEYLFWTRIVRGIKNDVSYH